MKANAKSFGTVLFMGFAYCSVDIMRNSDFGQKNTPKRREEKQKAIKQTEKNEKAIKDSI
jgi:hypothetical protein